MKKIIYILFIVSIGVLLFYIMLQKKDNTSVVTNSKVVEFPEISKHLYWNARSWGISGNHQEIILSLSLIDPDKWNYMKNKHYVFYTSEIYYKVENPNILIIYAPYSSIGEKPKNQSYKNIEVKIIELKAYKDVLNYSNNFKKYGLIKMSTF